MSPFNKFVEKRAFPRVPLEIPIKCRLIDGMVNAESISEMKKRTMRSKSRDVSLGGMFILREIPLDQGVIMALDFSLPEKPEGLSAFAEVVWINEEGAGLHFLALKDEDMESLKAALARTFPGR